MNLQVTIVIVVNTVDDINLPYPLTTLNYGKNGLFLVMGNAGFISSTVVVRKIMIIIVVTTVIILVIVSSKPSYLQDFLDPKP